MELTDYEMHRVITAYLQAAAVIVAAITLGLSMVKARIEKRNILNDEAHEGLLRFVKLSAKYPRLHLLHLEKHPDTDLSDEEKEVERSAYILLILTYERMYRYAKSTEQLGQLRKIEKMIEAYGSIDRFREARDLIVSISDLNFTDQLNELINKGSNT